MTPEQFCYWLQGLFELRENSDAPLSARQTQVVQDHLQLVFQKVTPTRPAEEAPKRVRRITQGNLEFLESGPELPQGPLVAAEVTEEKPARKLSPKEITAYWQGTKDTTRYC